ncbi:unnamed protein product [Adineta steineri]|uniref:Uncharacterized protein n=1 Tax=Adineta steineri TaxID=433720 RepID=A0A814Z377_9BILA|nr:unnamed protein product [Adineta steineri]
MSTAYQVFSWLSYIIGLFSFVFAIYVIPSNYWLEENFKSGLIITSTQAGLWKWCSYKVLAELSCDSLTKLDSRFRAAQALCVLVISGLLICATFFQYLIVLFHTTPEAKPQLQSDYGLSIMIFIATASGVAGVIQSIVLGCQMASASI